ncbi:MAG: protein-disulfide reductase DsbD N-terminal domain-containing protein [Betaproteobacteria bacterium]
MRPRHLRSAWAIALLALLPVAAAFAAALLPPHEAFALSARALDPQTLEARFKVADGYYLYRDKLKFNLDGAAPVTISAELPAGKVKHDEFFGDVETYRGLVVIRLPLATAQASHKLTLMTESQGCADVGVCYPPQRQVLTLDIPAAAAGPSEVVVAPIGRPAWLK